MAFSDRFGGKSLRPVFQNVIPITELQNLLSINPILVLLAANTDSQTSKKQSLQEKSKIANVKTVLAG